MLKCKTLIPTSELTRNCKRVLLWSHAIQTDSTDSADSTDSTDSTDSSDSAGSYFNPHLDRLGYF